MCTNSTPERILYIHGGTMNRGGTEAYMMNYYRHFDHDKLQVDFVVHGFEKGIYDDEIIAMGGNIYNVPIKSKDPIGNIKALHNILSSGDYRIVHAQLDTMNSLVLKIAKKCGVPVRISHSHNTAVQTQNPIKRIINEYTRKQIPKVATHLFACSGLAGKWLYGDNSFQVIPNAIDLERFSYNPQLRAQFRQELSLSETDIVLGHVGRFNEQKNHTFFVPLMKYLIDKDPRYKLVLIGDGPLKEPLQRLAAQQGVLDSIRFVEACPNVYAYYNVFDWFCMPSLFEGLPVVGIEAQANGLPLLVSDTVARELDKTGNVTFLPIDQQDVATWAQNIINTPAVRTSTRSTERLRAAGYDIHLSANKLQECYLSL